MKNKYTTDLTLLDNEVFKEFTDGYMVSNIGRVIYPAVYSSKGKLLYPKRIAHQTLSKNGYRLVKVKKKTFSVHRLVAMVFLDNPNNLPEVNHKDFNKGNNCVDNLEWISSEDNIFHAVLGGKNRLKSSYADKVKKVPIFNEVWVYSDNGFFIKKFYSKKSCANYLNVGVNSVSNYIDTLKSFCGFVFSSKHLSNPPVILPIVKSSVKKVYYIKKSISENKLIAIRKKIMSKRVVDGFTLEHKSIYSAGKELGLNDKHISKVLDKPNRTHKGYVFTSIL